jgi:ABC-type branched-subunit amino acid transport system ATPase component
VAFLGPDGSGKSTLTDLLVRRLQGHGDFLAVHRVYMGSGKPLLPTRRLVRRLHGNTGRNPKSATLRGVAPRCSARRRWSRASATSAGARSSHSRETQTP